MRTLPPPRASHLAPAVPLAGLALCQESAPTHMRTLPLCASHPKPSPAPPCRSPRRPGPLPSPPDAYGRCGDDCTSPETYSKRECGHPTSTFVSPCSLSQPGHTHTLTVQRACMRGAGSYCSCNQRPCARRIPCGNGRGPPAYWCVSNVHGVGTKLASGARRHRPCAASHIPVCARTHTQTHTRI